MKYNKISLISLCVFGSFCAFAWKRPWVFACILSRGRDKSNRWPVVQEIPDRARPPRFDDAKRVNDD